MNRDLISLVRILCVVSSQCARRSVRETAFEKVADNNFVEQFLKPFEMDRTV